MQQVLPSWAIWRRPRGRYLPPPWIIWWAIGSHLLWGFGFLTEPEQIRPIAVLIGLDRLFALGWPTNLIGVGLVVFGTLAAAALLLERRWPRWATFVMLMPQYCLLVGALISDGQSIVEGVVPPDRPISRIVLIVALGPLMWAAALHSVAIFERYRA